ncbi:MAG: hypothetical protein KA149_12880 [Chitinophagales bacterium]|nr:hypothetical protein [Chitinophagales bacterium]
MIPGEKDKPHKNEDESPDYNAEGAVNDELKPVNKEKIRKDEEEPENGLDIESIIMG